MDSFAVRFKTKKTQAIGSCAIVGILKKNIGSGKGIIPGVGNFS